MGTSEGPSIEKEQSREWFWYRVVLSVFILLGGGIRHAVGQQQLQLLTRTSTDSVLVGERFHVSIIARHAGTPSVLFLPADAGSVIFEDLEVVARSPHRSRRGGDGTQVDSVSYEGAAFSLDSVRVSSLPVQMVSGGDTTIATAPARTLTGASVVDTDAEGMHGVAPLASFRRPLWTWFLLALVGFDRIGGPVYYGWRHQPSEESCATSRRHATDQTPYEAATSWIRKLESHDLSDPHAVKEFYVDLSTALRVYLAQELRVATLKRTTREVVEVLSHRSDVPTEACACTIGLKSC